jgi:diguanylate cyclase (GGDEF)-like protein/PAS domain S-box-containing protein
MPEEAEEVAEIEHELRGKAHTAAIAALEVVPFAMLIADASGQALAVNGKWLDLSGLGRSNSLGAGWLSVLDPDTRHRLREDVVRVAAGEDGHTIDYQMGSELHRRWARWWISRHELDGLPLVAIAVADVDDDYSRQANLYHLATHDSLTGLINRSHFIECLDQALRRSQRQSRHVAVVYVDLDGFKRVNDRGGHSLGDRVLYAIAARLRHAVRSADMVARIGGDEFAVLCEGLGAADQADVVARRIALALQESVDLDGERWSVAASVGAAIDRGDPDNAEDLVDRADRAMYSVKLARRVPDENVASAPSGLDVTPEPTAFDRRGRREDENENGYSTRRAPVSPSGDMGHGASRSEAPSAAGPSPAPVRVAVDPGPAETGPAASSSPVRVSVLDPEEARRALRDLAEVASAFTSQQMPVEAQPMSAGDPARYRLAADVDSLRDSIDSIRRMLDRLLSSDNGVIDIRERDL